MSTSSSSARLGFQRLPAQWMDLESSVSSWLGFESSISQWTPASSEDAAKFVEGPDVGCRYGHALEGCGRLTASKICAPLPNFPNVVFCLTWRSYAFRSLPPHCVSHTSVRATSKGQPSRSLSGSVSFRGTLTGSQEPPTTLVLYMGFGALP